MKIRNNSNFTQLKPDTNKLLKKMFSPLCGFIQEIGFIDRGPIGPGIITAGVELTGVHILSKKEYPGRNAYHVGGSGIFLEEAMIKSLAESVERYAQLVCAIKESHNLIFLSYSEMKKSGKFILAKEKLNIYSENQYKNHNFPFDPFDESKPLSWVKACSLITQEPLWVPAQLLLVGYSCKDGEPWINSAVTTGTAVHIAPDKALLNSLLELIQLDSAMGHWYSNEQSIQIEFDDRTIFLKRFMDKHLKLWQELSVEISFHIINNPDLPAFTIACLIESKNSKLPRFSVGLGADTQLVNAMYKSLLEGIGVYNFAIYMLLKDAIEKNTVFDNTLPDIYNLNDNVSYYAKGNNEEIIRKKFPKNKTINATDIKKDMEGNIASQIKHIIKTFKETNKDLMYLDLNIPESEELGLYVTRVWSPDTLSLNLPSTPPALHKRFLDYNGFNHALFHPYP